MPLSPEEEQQRCNRSLIAAAAVGNAGAVGKLLAAGAKVDYVDYVDGFGNTAWDAAFEGGHADVVEKFLAAHNNGPGFLLPEQITNAEIWLAENRKDKLLADLREKALQIIPGDAKLQDWKDPLYTIYRVANIIHNIRHYTDDTGLDKHGQSSLTYHIGKLLTYLAQKSSTEVLEAVEEFKPLHDSAAKDKLETKWEVMPSCQTQCLAITPRAFSCLDTLIDLELEARAGLKHAIEVGDVEAVKRSIAIGTYVNQADDGGNTPLHLAVAKGNVDIVEALVAALTAADATLDKANGDGNTPLHLAVAKGNVDIVEALFAADATVDKENSYGETPLDLAVSKGSVDIVKFLLQTGAYVNKPLGKRATDLLSLAVGAGMEHVEAGHVEVVKILLANGVSVMGKGQHALYAKTLYVAIDNGNVKVAEILLEELIAARADPNIKLRSKTLLHVAFEKGNDAIVERLLAAGADVSWEDKDLMTELLSLADKSESVKRNLSATANKLAIYHGSDLPTLSMGILRSSLSPCAVKNLLAAGADVNACDHDEDGRDLRYGSALGYAVQSGSVDIVEILLANGADIEKKDGWGKTPLQVAAQSGQGGIVEQLLAAGANPNVKDSEGKTPLQVAPRSFHDTFAELLKAKSSGAASPSSSSAPAAAGGGAGLFGEEEKKLKKGRWSRFDAKKASDPTPGSKGSGAGKS